MKKNGEYVGVDEKFIPEDEKYVDESLLGNKEKTKKTVKSIAIGYIFFVIFLLAISIGIIIFIISTFNKTKDNMIENYNSETSKFDVSSFNGKFMGLQGTKVKFILSNFLDEVVTSNKTNKNHLISVTYEEITSTEESDIVKIKNSLKDNNKYEVSLDYDENGYINKVIIKNI